MKSIVVIFPYFGKLPPQYDIWRASAIRNPSIDFMFFTDTEIAPYKNIIVHKMKFEDFRIIVQKAFDFQIILDRPYKLCEYKPAYGYILKDYIKQYDFWGFGDLDLVYGNIRTFITDEVLKYKFILGWGHLSLFRNDSDTNEYFMKEENGFQKYTDAYTTRNITFFDEFDHMGCSDKWKACRPNDCWVETPFDNVSKPKQAFHFNSLTRGWQQVLFEHDGQHLYMIRIVNGKIEKKESLYAHFQHRAFMKDKISDYNHFLITPTSMIDFPKHMIKFHLLFYSRKRTFRTKLAQWKDRIIWKLNLGHYK